jgi:hypothetical protein
MQNECLNDLIVNINTKYNLAFLSFGIIEFDIDLIFRFCHLTLI